MAIFNTVPPLKAGNGIQFDGEVISTRAAPRNLLDNSDFRVPVMQDGLNGHHGVNKYVVDRWISWNKDAVLGGGYLTPKSPIDQYIEASQIDTHAAYTIVAYLADGGIITYTGKLDSGFGTYSQIYAGKSGEKYFVRLGTDQNIVAAALYEGAYTDDNAPAYQPKGYEIELTACRRFYQKTQVLAGTGANCSQRIWISTTKMRIVPTLVYSVISGKEPIEAIANGNAYIDVSAQVGSYSHLNIELCADL